MSEAKIAGMSAREVPGVHAMGNAVRRAFSAVTDRFPSGQTSVTTGIAVQKGETQAAVDAATLVDVVSAVPGVNGLEPGIATTLRTLDARLRRGDTSAARCGLVIDRAGGRIIVEIAVSGALPVRRIVEDVQRAVHRGVAGPGTTAPEVLVRVQSLSAP